MNSIKRHLKKTLLLLLSACITASFMISAETLSVQASGDDTDEIVNFKGDIGHVETGCENTSDEIFTWKKVTSEAELKSLFDNYGTLYGGSDWDGTIPIMLMTTRNGERVVVTSPGEDNEGYSETTDYDERKWNDDSDRTSTNNYRGTLLSVKDIDGLANSNDSDVIVTRGAYSPWYLEYSPVQETQQYDTNIQYDYVLHTYTTDSSGKYKASDYTMYAATDNDIYTCAIFKNLLNTEGQTRNCQNHWNITSNGTGTFEIWTNFYVHFSQDTTTGNTWWETLVGFFAGGPFGAWAAYEWSKEEVNYVARERTRFAVSGYSLAFFCHQNIDALRPETEYQFYASDDSYQKASNSSEQFEIWYGVPGVTSEVQQRVNGNTTLSKDAIAADVSTGVKLYTPDVISKGRTVSSGSTYAVPENAVVYIPYGSTLTIEEGATMIIGRNAMIINNGRIQNDGRIIVQPGALINFLDPSGLSLIDSGVLDGINFSGVADTSEYYTHVLAYYGAMTTEFSSATNANGVIPDDYKYKVKYVTNGRCMISGSGDLTIRDGGKVRTGGLYLTGDVNVGGLLIVENFYKQPGRLTVSNATILINYLCHRINITSYATDVLTGAFIRSNGAFSGEDDVKTVNTNSIWYGEYISGYLMSERVGEYHQVDSVNDSTIISPSRGKS